MIPSRLLKDTSRKAISEICYDELAALVPLMKKLHILDVDNVDERFLPFLAAWFRVEYWDDSLSTDLKRQKVKEALAVFRLLGTPTSVDQTLNFLADAYGVSLTLREWFEMSPEGQRGTFEVLLSTARSGAVLDNGIYNRIEAGVERNKRKSQHWGLRVSSENQGDVILAGWMRANETVSLMPALELIGVGVNDWMTSDFSPTTSFVGAVYSLVIQGAMGALTYSVTNGSATVNDAGDVTITGPGAVTVTATDGYGRQAVHSISPVLWFIQDGSVGVASNTEPEEWAASFGGRIPDIDEMTSTISSGRHMGYLYGEWGDLSVFGWNFSETATDPLNKYPATQVNEYGVRKIVYLCGEYARRTGDIGPSDLTPCSRCCVIEAPGATKNEVGNVE
ncbi:MAG: phage tail protein I [Kluyvera sp.]|uniref:phage tail protein I n=1 Tax=Kluyvera sp. TaxID=1538228 RepID=UPI003A836476